VARHTLSERAFTVETVKRPHGTVLSALESMLAQSAKEFGSPLAYRTGGTRHRNIIPAAVERWSTDH
jgi:hypothetical protein